MTWTKDKLVAFEQRVADAFLAKHIHAPVHLSGNNEEQLIEIFKEVRPQDWVFSTWRSHYHALLKGIQEQWVFDEVLAGRSMYLMNREHRFFASSIVGGILPIACGVAAAVQRAEKLQQKFQAKLNWTVRDYVDPILQPPKPSENVYVFVGDMTARTGLFSEFAQYARGHDLPVRVVIEDNGLSTNSPTEVTWGYCTEIDERHYRYERRWPHVGVGRKVEF